jgi:hypothetical protein
MFTKDKMKKNFRSPTTVENEFPGLVISAEKPPYFNQIPDSIQANSSTSRNKNASKILSYPEQDSIFNKPYVMDSGRNDGSEGFVVQS